MAQIPKGLGYIKSVPFFLKIGSFVVLLIAIVTLGIFLTEGNQDYSYKNDATINTFNVVGKKEYLDFGMAVIVLSWITVMSMVVLFVSGRHEKVTINWPALMVAIIMAIWGVLLFIAGCLMAHTALKYEVDVSKFHHDSSTFCDYLKKGLDKWPRSDARCDHLVGALVMCFIASVMFGVDAFLNFKLFRRKETPSAEPPAVPT